MVQGSTPTGRAAGLTLLAIQASTPPGWQHEKVKFTSHIKLPFFAKEWIDKWNVFRISRNPMGVYLGAAVHRTLRGIGTYAHMPTYEYLSLEKTRLLQGGIGGDHDDRVSVVKSPVGSDGKPTWDAPLALMKIVAFPGELVQRLDLNKRMDVEIRAHERAARVGCAPRFIGLVVESTRVIGYLSEFLPAAKNFSAIGTDLIKEDAESVSEIGNQPFEEGAEAVPEIDNQPIGRDVEAVSRLLKHLHAEGIVHGDLHPGNILRGADKTILLIDFEMATTREEHECPEQFHAYTQWESQRWNEDGLSWLR